MMYYEEIIAVICDNNKKPIREIDSIKQNNGRKTKIVIPFDSEYQFLIKNQSDKRIKISIDIDGSNVTNDGLIINSHSNVYLERFLNSERKFKFVKSTDENVSDPTNKENGVIKIRVSKEIEVFNTILNRRIDPLYQQYPPYIPWNIQTKPFEYYTNSPTWISSNDNNMMASSSDLKYTSNIKSLSYESGATIEGGKSNQKFDTTYWNGSQDNEVVFTFHLYGLSDHEKNKKLEQYLKLKEELGL